MGTIENDPRQAGALAGERELFGECSRWAVAPVHTRFEALEWFVWDAERVDPVTGGPAVVAQAATREEAIRAVPWRRGGV